MLIFLLIAPVHINKYVLLANIDNFISEDSIMQFKCFLIHLNYVFSPTDKIYFESDILVSTIKLNHLLICRDGKIFIIDSYD